MLFYKATGYAGTQGSIAFIVAVVIANIALTSLLIKKYLKLPFDKYFIGVFAVYCYLLFAMPYFYVFYTEDPGSHLSYFFLILAAFSVVFLQGRIWISILLASLLTTLAFLAKETYELVALAFSGLWLMFHWKKSRLRSLVPGIATVVGILVSVLNNMRLKSVFVNPDAEAGNPYAMNLSPVSILQQMWRYFREGMNIPNVLLALFIAWLVYAWFRKNKSERNAALFITLGCLAAPFLAWFPNALLPNHHYAGYSFNGLYLFYLPLFFVPALKNQNAINTASLLLLTLLIPASHFFNRKMYKDAGHKNFVFFEDTQRNFHNALDSLIGNLPPGKERQKVLIKGVTFTFSPFVYPESIREFPKAQLANYDVINYTGRFRYEGRRDLVRFINEADTGFAQYTRVWTFNNNGKLISGRKYLPDSTIRSGDSTGVLITLENLPEFKTSGIYSVEPSAIAWTNGNVSIDLNTSIHKNDTLNAKLSTYLPVECKDIEPKIILVDNEGMEHPAIQFNKKENIFYYRFITGGNSISKIKIISPTLPASENDKRILSFPFIELYVR